MWNETSSKFLCLLSSDVSILLVQSFASNFFSLKTYLPLHSSFEKTAKSIWFGEIATLLMMTVQRPVYNGENGELLFKADANRCTFPEGDLKWVDLVCLKICWRLCYVFDDLIYLENNGFVRFKVIEISQNQSLLLNYLLNTLDNLKNAYLQGITLEMVISLNNWSFRKKS